MIRKRFKSWRYRYKSPVDSLRQVRLAEVNRKTKGAVEVACMFKVARFI